MNNKIFEWAGVTTAILYSLFVALNIGIEFIGFSLLLLALEEHINPHYSTLSYTSYADYLQFIKNKLHKDSSKRA